MRASEILPSRLPSTRVEVLEGSDGPALAARLNDYLEAWQDLANESAESSPVYHPWFLLPSLKAFADEKTLVVALFFRRSDDRLLGVFPMERGRLNGVLRATCLRMFTHPYSFLATPLLRKGHLEETVSAFFDWLSEDARAASVFELGKVPTDGVVYQAMIDEIFRRNLMATVSDTHTRALLRPSERGEAGCENYLRLVMSSERKRKLRAQEKRLEQKGKVTYEQLHSSHAGEVGPWIEEFMRVEESGWKGRDGTAASQNPATRDFLRESLSAGFAQGKVMMLAQKVDGKCIAIKANLLDGPYAYAYKIAFDEAFSSFSPGINLEIENVRRFHDDAGMKSSLGRTVQWTDSCTAPGPSVFRQVWAERRIFETRAIATGQGWGEFCVSFLPAFRWVNRIIRRRVLAK